MTVRSIHARLAKLETRSGRSNEVLLVWRRPDSDVRQALAEARYGVGDKVLCSEWFDDGPMPEPRWYKDSVTKDCDSALSTNLNRCLERIRDEHRDPAFAPTPFIPQNRMVEMPDNDLLHAIIGVTT